MYNIKVPCILSVAKH
uniref:Uncharacterized protein n=1 Tax=Rhizophora mucronata TaxID=61149 RepID=A0A2P2NNJ2_RHIMU